VKLPHPVIFVPGITATYLRDYYPLPPEMVWTVLNKSYERVRLHPDDLRYEAGEPADIRPDQIYEIAYRECVEELRHNLTAKQDEPVPVFMFGHDWRQPLPGLVERLGAFIEEVAARTRLLRHYDRDGYDGRVALVGHSMGGLVIAGYLASAAGRGGKVARAVTIATPYCGSYEAVIKIVTGNANLGSGQPSSREREAARLTPALYHLLPRFPGALEVAGQPGATADFFDPAIWQRSVLASVEEYIRLYGLNIRDRRKTAQQLFEGLLGTASAYLNTVTTLKLADAGLSEREFLCIAGVGAETRFRMAVRTGRNPDFVIDKSDVADLWETGPDTDARYCTGDGTVPLHGAVPPFLPRNAVVCVSPDDFETFELQDRATAHLAGFHGIMPNMNMLIRLVVRFLRQGTDRRGNTWGRPLPEVTPAQWTPPLEGGLTVAPPRET